MAIKLNKEESLFRNVLIYAGDAKAVKIDNTLLYLCMLLRFNGVRPRARVRRDSQKTFIDIDFLIRIIASLEEEGKMQGFTDFPDATAMWLRSNIVDMVSRGNTEKENVTSLRPIHLESYRVRNAKHARDYNSADQVYLMLAAEPEVRRELGSYLGEGWDGTTNAITSHGKLDVDSLGILQLIKQAPRLPHPKDEGFSRVRPLLLDQAKLFCEDIHRLLVYQRDIPRSVIMKYLKTLTAFHLSIYTQKVIHYLPKMVRNGSTQVNDDWSIVVDMTDDLESRVAQYAIQDAEEVYNKTYDYVRATFVVNAVLRKLGLDHDYSAHLESALQELTSPASDFHTYFQFSWNTLLENQEADERAALLESTQFEDSYFDKYIQAIMEARWGYFKKYHVDLLDTISMKNSEKGLMLQGRSKRNPRRFVLGTQLLETLVQIMVLEPEKEKKTFYTRALSIEELMEKLRHRYGIIINGLGEERFKNADISTTLAFKENVEAFKAKLRQIGFYSDLSDAYILQKINPRYQVNA